MLMYKYFSITLITRRRRLPAALLLFSVLLSQAPLSAEVRLYSVPDAGYRKTDHFTVLANGKPVRLYSAKISTQKEFLTRESGHVNDSFTTAFATLDADEPVNFTVTVNYLAVKSASIKPTSLGLKPSVAGARVSFTAPKPGCYILQLNQSLFDHLYLIVNPLDRPPPPGDPQTILLEPGIHTKEISLAKNNQSLYLAPGAVLKGRVTIGKDVRGVRVCGRGFIDGEIYPGSKPVNLIKATRCEQLAIEGITLLDSPGWNVRLEDSKKVAVKGIKILSYRQNSDGIDPCSCEDAVVEDCFIRNYDDGVVVKLQRESRLISKNIQVRRCVVITDHGSSLKVGNNELLGPAVNQVYFTDCDVLFTKGSPLAVMNSGTAKVSDIHFDNIRIEDARIADQMSKWAKIPPTAILLELMIGGKNAYLQTYVPGTIRDIYFKNVSYVGEDRSIRPRLWVRNRSAQYNVEKVYLDNVTLYGAPVESLTADNSIIQEHTHGIFVKTAQSPQYKDLLRK